MTKFQRLSPEQTGTKGDPSTDGGCHMDSSVKTSGSLPSMPEPQFRGGRALIVLFCLFLSGCGHFGMLCGLNNNFCREKTCEVKTCKQGETCVMRDGKPKCERKAGE
jgi:hypothetical protein